MSQIEKNIRINTAFIWWIGIIGVLNFCFSFWRLTAPLYLDDYGMDWFVLVCGSGAFVANYYTMKGLLRLQTRLYESELFSMEMDLKEYR